MFVSSSVYFIFFFSSYESSMKRLMRYVLEIIFASIWNRGGFLSCSV